MRTVRVIGGSVTKFGRLTDLSLKEIVAQAVQGALKDAGVEKDQLQGAWVGNASQGVLDGQESIRGQVVLREMGIGGIPVVNVENACASSATALQGAWAMIALEEIEVALVVGMEKMHMADRSKALSAFMGCMDVSILPQMMEEFKKMEEKLTAKKKAEGGEEVQKSGERSVFMDVYALGARMHMDKYGTTQEQMAAICSKNHFHSSMNPLAHYQKLISTAEVLASPEVSYPLTRPMCSPIGDGAAAAIICSDKFAKKIGAKMGPEIAACVLSSGTDSLDEDEEDSDLGRTAQKAYEKSGLGPEDIDLAEVHDATAFGEIRSTESLGFCPPGEGGPFGAAGHTTLGGKIPVNVSGGLESQGHPIGATGIRQIVELYWHLTGQVGKRQVEGARIGLAQNAGGTVRFSEGALSVTILKQ